MNDAGLLLLLLQLLLLLLLLILLVLLLTPSFSSFIGINAIDLAVESRLSQLLQGMLALTTPSPHTLASTESSGHLLGPLRRARSSSELAYLSDCSWTEGPNMNSVLTASKFCDCRVLKYNPVSQMLSLGHLFFPARLFKKAILSH